MKEFQEIVSCVMCTYRRATCVERSIQFFLNQDYQGAKELIIFNTDTEYPLELSEELKGKNITIINNNTDYITNQPYNNIGAIRRDSLKHANGKYYICWDDDDIFLPWNIRQCMDGLKNNPEHWAWKPFRSMFWKSNHSPELAGNVMEASIISRTDKILEYGFDPHQGGGEHLAWERAFQSQSKMVVDKDSIPAYCFNWADQGEMRGHKQSGTYDREDNFEFHKSKTKDHAKGPLKVFDKSEVEKIYSEHIKVLKEKSDKKLENKHGDYIVKSNLLSKYAKVNFIQETELHIGTSYFDLNISSSLAKNYSLYLVEPNPSSFKKLKAKCDSTWPNQKNLNLLNLAISTYSGETDFYIFNPEKAKKYDIEPHIWMEGSSGIDPVRSDDPRICGQKWLDIGLDMYDKIKVPCLSFDDLVSNYNLKKVDFIKIDTEGHDLDIINQIDFNKLQVKKIQFEYFLAKSRSPESYDLVILKLNSLGFKEVEKNRQDITLER